MSDNPVPIRKALRAALPGVMKSGDTLSRDAIRATLAAIENAEAIEVAGPSGTTSPFVAGAAIGVGAAEAQRRQLSDDEVRAIVVAQRDERLEVAQTLLQMGQQGPAEKLQIEADVLDSFLG